MNSLIFEKKNIVLEAKLKMVFGSSTCVWT